MLVPLFGIVESALLNPAIKVCCANLVRMIQQWMPRLQKTYWRRLFSNALVIKDDGVGRKLRSAAIRIGIPLAVFVIEDD